jgi:predicted dehydrogenase
VIWDLAPHDFSIMDYLLGADIKGIAAHGSAHFNTGLEDVAYVTVQYANNLIAHFHLNWLAPTKIRRTIVGGSRKMLVWDDLNPDEKIRIYDKGAEVTTLEGKYGIQASYRMGDVITPWLESKEALPLEAQYFVNCINNGETPFNDGKQGLRVVSLLEATDASLKSGGKIIELKG